MHPVNEIFAAVEALRLLADAEEALKDHPARDGHHAATGYIAGLLADRLETIGTDFDERDWTPTHAVAGEQAVTH